MIQSISFLQKQAALASLLLGFFFSTNGQSFAVSSDGATVVVNEAHSNRLYVTNLLLKEKSEIIIGAGSDNWVQLLGDTLAMVQYSYSTDRTVVYSLVTGRQVFASQERLFATSDGTTLYSIDQNWKLHQYKLPGFEPTGTGITLKAEKGGQPSGFLKFSTDRSRVLAGYGLYEKGKVGVFEMAGGRLVGALSGFTCCDAFTGASLFETRFLDLDVTGTIIVAGNEKEAKILRLNKGNKAVIMQASSGEEADYSSAAFSANGKTVYLQSRKRIFIQDLKENAATDTLTVAGKWLPYGTPVKYDLAEEFTWKEIVLAKDNRFLFMLCEPKAGASGEDPFIMRVKINPGGFGLPEKFFYR